MWSLMGLGYGFNELVSDYQSFQKNSSTNSGNLLFNFAINQLINLSVQKYLWSTSSEIINNNNSNLIIPMANNIGPHMDILKQGPKISGVDKKAVVIGIGAQWSLDQKEKNVPPGTIEWLKMVSDMSDTPNISVRGHVTNDFFKEIGLENSTKVLGCPSLLINKNLDLGQKIKEKANNINLVSPSIGIAAGNQYLANLTKLEQWLIKQAESTGSKYLVQHPKQLICLAEGFFEQLTSDDIELVRERWFSDLTAGEMKRWFTEHSTTYLSVPQWILDSRKYDLMLGTRIHGVQIGIQAGTPAVCLYIDSRTKELCETMKIPHLSAREFQKNPSIERVIELIKSWDWEDFDRNRLALAKLHYDFFKANKVDIKNHLLNLVQ